MYECVCMIVIVSCPTRDVYAQMHIYIYKYICVCTGKNETKSNLRDNTDDKKK